MLPAAGMSRPAAAPIEASIPTVVVLPAVSVTDCVTDQSPSARTGREQPVAAPTTYEHVTVVEPFVAVIVTVGLEMPEINFTHAETVCLPFGPPGQPADTIATFGQHFSRSGLPRVS